MLCEKKHMVFQDPDFLVVQGIDVLRIRNTV